MCPHFWLVAKSPPNERRQYCFKVRGLMVSETLLLMVNLPQPHLWRLLLLSVVRRFRSMQVNPCGPSCSRRLLEYLASLRIVLHPDAL